MKKTYMAPEILFEDFSLSTSIAAGCEKVITPVLYQCGVNYPGLGIIFTDAAWGCKIKVEDGNSLGGGYCYHIPSESANMFNS